MNWFRTYPTEPGFYWVVEEDDEPYIVEISVESDSHGMLYVLLPGETKKYPIETWNKAYWYGPLVSLQ